MYCGRSCQSKAYRTRLAATRQPSRPAGSVDGPDRRGDDIEPAAGAGRSVLDAAESIRREAARYVSELEASEDPDRALARLRHELPALLSQLLRQAHIARQESDGCPPPAGTARISTRDEKTDGGTAGDGKRGPYAKGLARRAEVLDAALATIAERGYHRSTFQEIAERVGVRPGTITHYFGSRQNLMAAIVEARDNADAPVLDALGTDFRSKVHYLQSTPGLIRLFVNLSAEATDENHDGHEFFAARYARLRKVFEEQIRRQQEEGVVDPAVDPGWLARAVVALVDGLQIQWLYDPTIDMAGDLETLMLGKLR
ncbi:hypothetical protein GCM10010313_13380 [Streptomyces violarus]|nr:hypothetical protein GCM10010313_13380 [Streptomyces violarus]